MSKFEIDQNPCHVAIIMDGNGRWAQSRLKQRLFGHRSAINVVRMLIKLTAQRHIPYLTLFAFGKENWGRPQAEIDGLFNLLRQCLVNELDELHAQSVRIYVIGDMSELPQDLQQAITNAQQKTKDNTGLTLCLAINYSGRWDITQAVNAIQNNGLVPSSESDVSAYLQTSKLPDPDLLIRTSGEQRLSNFLLWQCAYTELYFAPCHFPEFDETVYLDALQWFASRERRQGRTSEQCQQEVIS